MLRLSDAETRGTAVIVALADGTVTDATPAALDLLGATLEELKAAPPGTLSARPAPQAEQDALRTEWEDAGTPTLGGESTLKRRDGTERRVRYLVDQDPQGRFIIVLVPLDAPPDAEWTVNGLGDVLTAWRAAERRLEEIASGSPEWRNVTAEIMTLRDACHDLFRTRRGA